MGQSIFPIPATTSTSVPNWQLLQTATPSGVGSVTFSGLSAYSKYRITLFCSLANASAPFQLKVNNGTASTSWGQELTGTTLANRGPYQPYSLIESLSMASGVQGWVEIDAALTTNHVIKSSFFGNGTTAGVNTSDGYSTDGVITSLVITSSGAATLFSVVMTLLGAN